MKSTALKGLVLVMAAGFAAMGACGRKADAPAGASGEIRVFTFGYPPEKMAREQQAEVFQKRFPNIKVNMEVSPDYDRKLTAMLAANDGPDIWEVCDDHFHMFSPDLTDLRPYIERDRVDLSIFYDRAINGYILNDGMIEALPIGLCPFVLAINKDLFREAGAAVPAGDSWTWDELLEAAGKITRGSGPSKVFGLGDHWVFQQTAPWYFGGRYYNNDFTEILFDSPESVRGIQHFADLIWKYKVYPNFEEASGVVANQRFFGGRSGIQAVNIRGLNDFITTIGDNFDWNIVRMPTTGETGETPIWSIVQGYGIWRGSKNKEAAWAFTKWATTDPESLAICALAAVPPTKNAAEIVRAYNWEKKDLNTQALINSIPDAILVQPGGPFAQVADIYNAFWDSVKKGETADMAQGAKDLAARGRVILRSLNLSGVNK
ncbi:MAG: sugar ABC transporter substrate-binding protein [Treponema sp.]|jgi:multiple sugar transport system substrate-binding protein|nr:sugar ABC transporter substrate-binding protein [Treponema sp.]